MAAESSLLIARMSLLATLVNRWAEAGADALAAASVMYSPAIWPAGFRLILKSQAPRSAVTRTMAVGPVTCGAPASFNLPLADTSPRKKGVALSGGNTRCI